MIATNPYKWMLTDQFGKQYTCNSDGFTDLSLDEVVSLKDMIRIDFFISNSSMPIIGFRLKPNMKIIHETRVISDRFRYCIDYVKHNNISRSVVYVIGYIDNDFTFEAWIDIRGNIEIFNYGY